MKRFGKLVAVGLLTFGLLGNTTHAEKNMERVKDKKLIIKEVVGDFLDSKTTNDFMARLVYKNPKTNVKIDAALIFGMLQTSGTDYFIDIKGGSLKDDGMRKDRAQIISHTSAHGVYALPPAISKQLKNNETVEAKIIAYPTSDKGHIKINTPDGSLGIDIVLANEEGSVGQPAPRPQVSPTVTKTDKQIKLAENKKLKFHVGGIWGTRSTPVFTSINESGHSIRIEKQVKQDSLTGRTSYEKIILKNIYTDGDKFYIDIDAQLVFKGTRTAPMPILIQGVKRAFLGDSKTGKIGKIVYELPEAISNAFKDQDNVEIMIRDAIRRDHESAELEYKTPNISFVLKLLSEEKSKPTTDAESHVLELLKNTLKKAKQEEADLRIKINLWERTIESTKKKIAVFEEQGVKYSSRLERMVQYYQKKLTKAKKDLSFVQESIRMLEKQHPLE